jgi:hypothetical protein
LGIGRRGHPTIRRPKTSIEDISYTEEAVADIVGLKRMTTTGRPAI